MSDEIKNFSVDGAELLSEGNNSRVYRLDADKIIKLYKSANISEDYIKRELYNARTVFAVGVPTPRVYEAVKVGNVFGLIFELVDAPSLKDFVLENPSSAEVIAVKEAALLKKFHGINFSAGTLPYSEKNLS